LFLVLQYRDDASELPSSGDAVIERDGVEILFVDEESAQLLRGSTAGLSRRAHWRWFQVVNPNAARTCGCGSSLKRGARSKVSELR